MPLKSALQSFLESQPSVQQITVPEGTMVCQSGDVCENLVIVLQGQVKVFRPAASGRSLTLYYVDEGDTCILTASCILNQTPFPAFAVTMTEVTALSVPPTKVIEWLEQEPMWQRYVFSLLSRRMNNLIELVDSVAFEGLDVRLVNHLLQLDQQAGGQLMTITHQQIAEDLASSREVISRLLKKLEQTGTIELGRGTIQMINRGELKNS